MVGGPHLNGLEPARSGPWSEQASTARVGSLPASSNGGRIVERIHLSPPHLDGSERAYVDDAFASNWIAPLGPHVDAFEQELAAHAGVRAAAALASGTAAIHLALRLLGVGPGDTVLAPTLTFIASVNPIVYLGATPVLVDVDPATWTIDPDLVEEELVRLAGSGTPAKAVVAVDLYGQCADYERLEAVCDRHGVALVEDAAEALGATAYRRPAGAFGRFGVFSFNGNKIITTSGGGALVSDDDMAIGTARFLASQARDPAPHYEHSTVGYNYRLSNVLAAIGRAQLAVLPARVEARRAIFDRYVDGLGDLPGVTFMPEAPYGRSNRWLTVIRIDPDASGVDREDVRLALEAANIEARPVWKPMHLQPVYRDARTVGGTVAESLFDDGLCLPSGSALTEAQQGRVIDVVRRTLGG